MRQLVVALAHLFALHRSVRAEVSTRFWKLSMSARPAKPKLKVQTSKRNGDGLKARAHRAHLSNGKGPNDPLPSRNFGMPTFA